MNLKHQAEDESRWAEMLRVFRQDVAPGLMRGVAVGVVLGLLFGLAFGSALNGVLIGSTLGVMMGGSEKTFSPPLSIKFPLSIGIGLSYGTMFHNIPLGVVLGMSIPWLLELAPLKRVRK
jgi:hypothetical protein